MSVRILLGDCRERLRDLADNSVDSVVCDPPYHLTSIVKRFGPENAAPAQSKQTGVYARSSKGFMGQTWDGGDVAFQPETWAEVLRVLKPGGHLVAFSGTRTYHRMAVAIEDAGFEVRDMIAWHYGSGFPKSLDVSKAIDKARRRDFVLAAVEVGVEIPGNSLHDWTKAEHAPGDKWWAEFKAALPETTWAAIERKVVGYTRGRSAKSGLMFDGGFSCGGDDPVTAPATDAAREWEGYGTALKPATEPICLARKPISEKSVAANVLKWGTGALNIDGCRVHADDAQGGEYEVKRLKPGATLNKTGGNWRPDNEDAARFKGEMKVGRWPANLCHDGSDEVLAGFPDAPGQIAPQSTSAGSREGQRVYGAMKRGNGREGEASADRRYADNGATNFAPLPGQRRDDSGSAARFFYCAKATTEERGEGNNHPTVKPQALMRWLCRLVTPKGGTVLDPFMGSGSTALACDAEQFNFIGCELSADYAAIAEKRIRDAAGMFADVKVAA